MADLDLRKLRYFVAVARELSFGRAAAVLQIAQPALSRQISSLETELDVVLFDRSKAGTSLTPAGEVLLVDAERLLAHTDALRRRVEPRGETPETFVLGVAPGIVVTAMVRTLAERFPDLDVRTVHTTADDQVSVVHDGTADVSIARLPFDTEGLTVRPLFTERRFVALPTRHPLTVRHSLSVDDLTSFPLLQDADTVPEWRDTTMLDSSQRPARLPSTLDEQLEHVAAGRGVVVLPESAAMMYTRPDVMYRNVVGLAPGEVAIVHWSGRRSEVVDVAVNIARRVLSVSGIPPLG